MPQAAASAHYCGLCRHAVHDWDDHVAGDEHQTNLTDPDAILDAVCASSADSPLALLYLDTLEATCRARQKQPNR